MSKDLAIKEKARRELMKRKGLSQSATAGYSQPPNFNKKVGFPDPIRPDFDEGAPWVTQAKSAFIDDPQAKLNLYAKDMFPNEPDASKRFGYKDDEIVYRDKDWNLKYAKPDGVMGFLKNFSAEQPAYLPHEVLGGAGAMTGNPWIAGLGVMAGEATRKMIADAAFDQPYPKDDAVDLTTNGLLAGVLPTSIGKRIAKGLQRGVVRDIDNLNPDSLTYLSNAAKANNIPLTVAEKTNLGSLKGYQTALNNITDSADDMARFYDGRNQNINDAVNKTLNSISPIDSAEDAAGLAVQAAHGARNKIQQAMREKASPLYKKAYESGSVDISDVVKGIDETISRYPDSSQTIRSLAKSKALLTRKVKDEVGNVTRVPQDNFEILDYAKRDIDDLIGSAQRKGNNNIVRELTDHKNALLTRMDELSPDYKIARQIWTEGSDALDKLDSTAVKVIANLPEEKWQTAATRMFNPKTTGVNAVTKAKNIIAKEDPEAWNGLVRSYIESAWQDAGDVASGSKGYTFKRMIFGNEGSKKRAVLKAAMEPDQFKSFNDLMNVLDATGRVKQVGSDTAYKQEIIKELNEKWGSGWNDVIRPIGFIKEKLGRARIGNNAKKMAEILTTQDGVESIKLIKQLKPGSQASINALATFLGVQTAAEDVSVSDSIPSANQ